MLSFKSFILLIEATADELYNKFYSDIDRETFEKLWKADPTAKENMFGDYSRWIVEKFKKLNPIQKKRFVDEDHYKIKSSLDLYNKAKKINKIDKKDINQFKTYDDLISYVEEQDLDPDELETRGELEKKLKSGAKKVYEDSNWLILVPETHEAACYYGAGTRWCTATKDNSRYFDQYSDEGPLYIIINKKEKDDTGRQVKYQFHFHTNQYMDDKDNQLIDIHTSSDAKEWIRYNISDEAVEYFDSVYTSLLDKIYSSDPRDQEEIKKFMEDNFNTTKINGKEYYIEDKLYRPFREAHKLSLDLVDIIDRYYIDSFKNNTRIEMVLEYIFKYEDISDKFFNYFRNQLPQNIADQTDTLVGLLSYLRKENDIFFKKLEDFYNNLVLFDNISSYLVQALQTLLSKTYYAMGASDVISTYPGLFIDGETEMSLNPDPSIFFEESDGGIWVCYGIDDNEFKRAIIATGENIFYKADDNDNYYEIRELLAQHDLISLSTFDNAEEYFIGVFEEFLDDYIKKDISKYIDPRQMKLDLESFKEFNLKRIDPDILKDE